VIWCSNYREGKKKGEIKKEAGIGKLKKHHEPFLVLGCRLLQFCWCTTNFPTE